MQDFSHDTVLRLRTTPFLPAVIGGSVKQPFQLLLEVIMRIFAARPSIGRQWVRLWRTGCKEEDEKDLDGLLRGPFVDAPGEAHDCFISATLYAHLSRSHYEK
ncbi:hypothetical protein PG985_014591 [Apiospora marii]|uniref:Uncharacterized protein n=1 Tax=Apiospora marii TaxID=335849 RepID=A0ABR1R4R7_9PEZI